MNYKIAVIKGDGIGPEIVTEAVGIIEAVGQKFGHTFEFVEVLLGGCATDAVGKSYPDGTAELCKAWALSAAPSGDRISPRNSVRRPLCWLSARILDCMPTFVTPPSAPLWWTTLR